MATCDYVVVDGVNIPGVSGIQATYTPLATARRALSGALRVDTLAGVGVKRSWRVNLSHLVTSERLQVLDLITSNPGVRTVAIHTVGTVTGTIRVTGDNRSAGVIAHPVGPLAWSDGKTRLWSNGAPAIGSDPVAGVTGAYRDYGGGNLELRIEEA